jgi:hypothetical protein
VADDAWDAIDKGQICEAIEEYLDLVLKHIEEGE